MYLFRICSSGDNPCKSGAVAFHARFTEDSAWGGHSFTAAPPIIFFPYCRTAVCIQWLKGLNLLQLLPAFTYNFFYKGTYLHLSFQGRKSDSSKDVCNASTVCSLSNVTWMLYIVAGIRRKCCDARCLTLLLLNGYRYNCLSAGYYNAYFPCSQLQLYNARKTVECPLCDLELQSSIKFSLLKKNSNLSICSNLSCIMANYKGRERFNHVKVFLAFILFFYFFLFKPGTFLQHSLWEKKELLKCF